MRLFIFDNNKILFDLMRLGIVNIAIHFLLLMLIFPMDVSAQPKRLQFKHITVDDGLSSSLVLSIIQDNKGFIWTGTSDGLNRYDGFNFVTYRADPLDSTSLSDNAVQSLYVDHDDNLLIGTEIGLCLYDREKDHFLNYTVDKSSPLKGMYFNLADIEEDSLGGLWLATSSGLIYFNRAKNTIKQFVHDPGKPESLCNNALESILIDKKNRLWVATRNGIDQYLPESESFKHLNVDRSFDVDLLGAFFQDIAEDKEGNIWFGSSDGLYCLKDNQTDLSQKLIHYQHNDLDKNSLSVNQVISLFVDEAGNLWIGTDNGGIDLFDRQKQIFWHYRKDEYDPHSLNNESIETIYQDKSGNLWFGTFNGGLNVSMNNMEAIVKYQNFPGRSNSLSNNNVTCFLEDSFNQIWIGTDGGGLNIFNKPENSFSHFNTNNSRLTSNYILCMLEDSRKQIWIGTYGGGLVRYDNRTKSFTSFTIRNSGIPENSIFAIAEGDDGDLWIGSLEHGLIRFQVGDKKFTEYNTSNSSLANAMVKTVVKYSDGRLLIGSPEGFQIFYPADNHFETYRSDNNNKNCLSYSRVIDILPENDSCIWIGTQKGLNKFNPEKGSFVNYYEKDGLPKDFIKGLVLDKSGALWITTNQGVCRFDYKQGKFKTFTKSDGLQSNEFYDKSVLKTKNGDLLMGGNNGFNIVYPEKLVENKRIPEVIITDLKIFNKSVKPLTEGSPLEKSITETEKLVLPHGLSVITFCFAAMDFTAPEKNQYAYKMENFDKEWTLGNKREATYTNLNPGDYIFLVRGSNNDGFWNEEGTSIHITVLPPWWSMWWFRIIIFIALILIISSFFMLRIRSLKNKKILLEKLVEEKTSELKAMNVSKDKILSIIAHDLRSPFNSIIGFSNVLKEEIRSGNPAQNEEFARLINASAVQTLRLLDNLLEWAGSQSSKRMFEPSQVKLRELLDEEFYILNDFAAGKDIELKNLVAGELMIFADRNMIRTIIRNLIINAIKFTRKGGEVVVTAISDRKNVEVSVADTGLGMTKETIEKLFRMDVNVSTRGTENEKGTGLGLLLCKEFVEKHGGKIWVESELDKGSVFSFSLPLNNNPLV